MRIGIDARFYSEQGHGRYIRNLLKELQALDNENEYIVFLRKSDFDKVTFTNPKFDKVEADIRWYTLKEQTKLLQIYLSAKLDLLHVPHFNVPILYHKPYIITIHDLTITHFPSIRATTLPFFVWKLKRFGYHLALRIAIMRAKKIIAVSEFTKSEILRFYPAIPEKKITVTLEAVEQQFIEKANALKIETKSIDFVKAKYGIAKQYLIYIGNVHPHKNIERLLRVFQKLNTDLEQSIELVMVGKDDYFQNRMREEAKAKGLEAGVIWTGFVPDEDLMPLIKGAAAFVFPSLMEGFGIPPLEAMAIGTPTVISNAGSLPEVCGDAASYFDPKNEDEMYQKIKAVLESADLRLTLMQKGYERINDFSWERMARQTLTVYQEPQ